MSNGDDVNGKRYWPHLRDFVLIAGVATGGSFAYNNNDQISQFGERLVRLDERLGGHIGNHPNVGLQRQINDIRQDIRDLEERQRELERQYPSRTEFE